jgi:hypothetical protein
MQTSEPSKDYVPPRVLKMGDMHIGAGDCITNGSGDADDCKDYGASAKDWCEEYGATAAVRCSHDGGDFGGLGPCSSGNKP